MSNITFNNPVQDGHTEKHGDTYYHVYDADDLDIGPPASGDNYRAYIEWDISDIPDGSTITLVKFRYEGRTYNKNCEIRAIANQPTAQPANQTGYQTIYDDSGDGTIYVSPEGFPEVGTNKEIDLGEEACIDLQNNLDVNWFAIGVRNIDEVYDWELDFNAISSEDFIGITTPPTLYVEYTVAPESKIGPFPTHFNT